MIIAIKTEYGDGSLDSGLTTGTDIGTNHTFNHTYATPGTYTVRLTVKIENGIYVLKTCVIEYTIVVSLSEKEKPQVHTSKV